MSWASKNIFDPLKAAFSAAVNLGGSGSASAASAASANLTQAQALVEASVSSLATIGVNAVLGLIPEGTAFEGLADELVAQVVAKLLAAHPAASTAVAPPSPPVQTSVTGGG